MEDKKFDFSLFLQQLIPKITTYTQIHLIQITQTCISFTIRWIISHKHKHYRFNFPPQQAEPYLAILATHLALYPIRRFTLASKSLKLAASLAKLAFDEIIYEEGEKQMQEALHFIFTSWSAKKITFSHPLSFQHAIKATSFVHKYFPKSDVNMHFIVSNYQMNQQVLNFLSEWGFSLPEQPALIAENQKQFGYPFPISHKDKVTKRREQISVAHKNSQIFTLRQLDNLGCQVIFHQEVSEDFLKEIIEVLFKLKRFASLQITQLAGPALIKLIETVLALFEDDYYRIVVGHQLELTPCRLTLNTTGLSNEEVGRIFELMKQPGHYEVICYSSAEHFAAAVELFRSKPLIKFNFFLPLEELPPLEQLIKSMERHANLLLLKVYSYAGLLKRLAKLGFLAVNSVFYSLGSRP